MISARHWRERRNFGLTLIFWAWLASFVFGFAASDTFHTASCAEELALRAAHDKGPTLSPASASHAFPLDLDCPTSLLQLGAQGILAIVPLVAAPFIVVFIFAASSLLLVSARAELQRARPTSFVTLTQISGADIPFAHQLYFPLALPALALRRRFFARRPTRFPFSLRARFSRQ